MSVRIHLHTLGDALITVNGKEVRPTSPMVFAALLYLCFERGHRVPRTALQELLFPDADERSGAHSVRQLLYKLRQLGVPLRSYETALELPAEHVRDDSPAGDMIAANDGLLAGMSAGLLPGFYPRISPAFDQWLDEQRDLASARARHAMLDALARSREAGDHLAMEAIASAILRQDPLNEEATLVRAEALALTGQKHDAVRVLERYSADVGATSPHLRIPPDVLRRRIAERFHVSDRAAVPMLGRQEELAFLLAQFARANDGHGTVSVVWGDAGIGKTRLVQEFSSHLVLKNARVESAHCQPFDRERPLGALVDLVPKLLQARGALGVSPESLRQLKRLSGEIPPDQPRETHPELTSARIREAIGDLLLCVSTERPLVLLVEDAHWLDEASLRLLFQLVSGQSAPLHLVITMRDRPRFPNGARISESVLVRQLTPLSDAVATDLLMRTLGTGFAVDTPVREQCVALAAGNPLFICTVAEHLRVRGAAPSTQSGIADLLKQRIRILDAPTLLLLRTIAALGNHATPDRLRSCTGMSLEVELLALQDLADRGLIVRQDGSIRCAHDVLTEVVLSDAPPAIRTTLYERAATVLEEDGTAGKQVQLLWSCAESWRQADDPTAAARVLSRCAEFALEIGQPSFAIASLEQALQSCGEEAQAALRHELVRIADLAGDVEAVIRNAKGYRDIAAQGGHAIAPHSPVILAEIGAMHRAGLGRTQALDRNLKTIALDQSAPTVARVEATRQFLVSAELTFQRESAAELYAAMEPVLDSDGSIEAFRTQMHFHAAFGDMARAQAIAIELLRRLRKQEVLARIRPSVGVGRVLFETGATDSALEVMHDAAAETEKLGVRDHLMLIYCILSDYGLMQGDHTTAERWHARANALYVSGVTSTTGYHLSNAIELAFFRGDPDVARDRLSELRRHHEAGWPHAARTIHGFQLRLWAIQGSVPAGLDLEEILAHDTIGRHYTNHHVFALGAFSLLTLSGQQAVAGRRWLEYVGLERRERFPLDPYVMRAIANLRIAQAVISAMPKSVVGQSNSHRPGAATL